MSAEVNQVEVDAGWAPRKLSHEAGRAEQRAYWLGKSMAERLAAGTALTERLYRMRGIDRNERKTDWTVSRVRRSRDLTDVEELLLLARDGESL